MSYLAIVEEPSHPSHKTRRWKVLNIRGHLLGIIQWCSPWRQYTFEPCFPTIFEEDCLREIAQFVEDRTKEHRGG